MIYLGVHSGTSIIQSQISGLENCIHSRTELYFNRTYNSCQNTLIEQSFVLCIIESLDNRRPTVCMCNGEYHL